MKTLFLIITLLILTGCQNSSVQVGDAKLTRWSFMYPLKFQSAEFTTTSTNGAKGAIKLKGYESPQAEMAGAVAEGVANGLAKGIKP